MKKPLVTCDTPHNHRCDCGIVWHHDPKLLHVEGLTREESSAIWQRAHSCPKCGTRVCQVDYSGQAPLFCSNGVRINPLPVGCRLGIGPEPTDEYVPEFLDWLAELSASVEVEMGRRGIVR